MRWFSGAASLDVRGEVQATPGKSLMVMPWSCPGCRSPALHHRECVPPKFTPSARAPATRINIDAVAMARFTTLVSPVTNRTPASLPPPRPWKRRCGAGHPWKSPLPRMKARRDTAGSRRVAHVVHGAAHRQTADVAAGEEMRRHHEAVRGVGDALPARGPAPFHVIAAQSNRCRRPRKPRR